DDDGNFKLSGAVLGGFWLARRRRNFCTGRRRRRRFLEHGAPFVGKIHFLNSRRRRNGRCGNDVRRRFGGRKSFLFDGSFGLGILGYSGTRRQKIFIGKARSAL